MIAFGAIGAVGLDRAIVQFGLGLSDNQALVETLQKLSMEGATGTLFLTLPDRRQARIGLLRGGIVHLTLFTLRGELVIRALANLKGREGRRLEIPSSTLDHFAPENYEGVSFRDRKRFPGFLYYGSGPVEIGAVLLAILVLVPWNSR